MKLWNLILFSVFYVSTFSILFAQQSQTSVFEDWVSFKGTSNMFIENKSVIDSQQNIYVLGSSINSNGNYDIMVIKYDRKGNLIWEDYVNGSGNGDDYGFDLALTPSDGLVVTGTINNSGSNYDLFVKKYEASTGVVIWTESYDNNLIDGGTSLSISFDGDIYVGGGTMPNNFTTDFLIVKYNSDGINQWVNTYDYNGFNELVTKIKYKGGKLVVSGVSESVEGTWEMAFAGLNPITGDISSVYRTGGTAQGVDKVSDIFVTENKLLCRGGSK